MKYLTVNDLNPNFMKTIFTSKTNSRVQPLNLLVKNCNTENYGSKKSHGTGTKNMECITWKYKKETSFTKFKEYVKSWSGPTCKWKLCLSI